MGDVLKDQLLVMPFIKPLAPGVCAGLPDMLVQRVGEDVANPAPTTGLFHHALLDERRQTGTLIGVNRFAFAYPVKDQKIIERKAHAALARQSVKILNEARVAQLAVEYQRDLGVIGPAIVRAIFAFLDTDAEYAVRALVQAWLQAATPHR